MPFGSPFGNVQGITNIPPPQLPAPPRPGSMEEFYQAFKMIGSNPPPLPASTPLPPPISFNEFIGGAQSVSKVLTSPARDLIGAIGGATKEATSSLSGMTLPLLIGGGVVLLVVLMRK